MVGDWTTGLDDYNSEKGHPELFRGRLSDIQVSDQKRKEKGDQEQRFLALVLERKNQEREREAIGYLLERVFSLL